MAKLVTDQSRLIADAALSQPVREWLNGSWALLFSNPEHFAPNPSTPKGYLTCLASMLAENGIKLIELAPQKTTASWVEESDPERKTLSLATPCEAEVLDLPAHALIKNIRATARPFVMVLDHHSQCRTTLKYRPENIVRPRTLEDIVETIYVLRGDETASAEKHECRQERGWRVKTW